ncbi:PXA domain-containing protein [Aspergillus avenaceus]|uniref:PXA domain-containing protein n=1 Tax=Aspergillus avenaceus TaxID=36643 RepID=A0A5N6TDJ9_ASPAV|nr:PXA domain-containing protein [Aspergillus avenaceus]
MNTNCGKANSQSNEIRPSNKINVVTCPTPHLAQVGNHEPNVIAPPKEYTAFILNFLSTCSNEALLGVLACLVGATYILLGRLGLILIGLASGIALHASWEGSGMQRTSALLGIRIPNTRRNSALDVSQRLLDWPKHTQRVVESNQYDLQETQIGNMEEVEYSSFRPQTALALRSLTDAAMRNYVNHWYEQIAPSETSFPLSCRRVISGFITSASTHLVRKRAADTFLEFLTNSASISIVFLNQLSTAFESAGPSTTPEQAVHRYLELSPESSLANVLSDKQQRKKLNLIADDILSNFLDAKDYAFPPLRHLLRETLAGAVLESAISSLARPEFINGWIIHLFKEGESEIMSAIDAGVEGAKSQDMTETKKSSELDNDFQVFTKGTAPETKHFSRPLEQEPALTDKATEAAIMEAKRLSAMIAAQDLLQDNAKETESKNSEELAVFNIETLARADEDSGMPEDCTTHSIKASDPNSEKCFETNTTSNRAFPDPLSHRPSSYLSESTVPTSLTLHRASVTIDASSDNGDKSLMRSRPTSNYLLQIEPASARCTGWMVFRKYADFESLHEALQTISRLNKLQQFAKDHPCLPHWKGQTQQNLAKDLQRYLQNALQYEPLAESERMKRFLEKDGRPGRESVRTPAKATFNFPNQVSLESVGKGVLDVLASAPRGVSGGGKAVFDGVTGVFGAVTNRKAPSKSVTYNSNNGMADSRLPCEEDYYKVKDIKDYQHEASLLSSGAAKNSISPETAFGETDEKSAEFCKEANAQGLAEITENTAIQLTLQPEPSTTSIPESDIYSFSGPQPSSHPPGKKELHRNERECMLDAERNDSRNFGHPITEEETRMAVELIFAVINELYTLSSAWNIRRTLLNAAKSYILRPGNPNLETIHGLLQESMIESNTSDEAIGFYINKLRENTLPTEAELRSWLPPPDDAEKDRLQRAARKAFVQKGLPQALTSVMGAVASREALEKIFDSLQVPIVAKGFVFSVMLQALKAVVL